MKKRKKIIMRLKTRMGCRKKIKKVLLMENKNKNKKIRLVMFQK